MSRSSVRSWLAFALLAAAIGVVLLVPAAAHAETPQEYVTKAKLSGTDLGTSVRFWLNPLPTVPLVLEASPTVTVPDPPEVSFAHLEYALTRNNDSAAAFGVDRPVARVPISPLGGRVAPTITDFALWMALWPDNATPVLPVLPWPPVANQPVEGVWWLHTRSVAATPSAGGWSDPADAYGQSLNYPIGVDVTHPSQVETVSVWNPFLPGPPSNTITSTVAFLQWPNRNSYDVLSGVWGWQVKVNGVLSDTFRRAFVELQDATASTTVYGLREGENTIEIAAVDWARNVGQYRTVTVYVVPTPPVFPTAISVEGTSLADPLVVTWFNARPHVSAAFSADPLFAALGGSWFQYALAQNPSIDLDSDLLATLTPWGTPLGGTQLNMRGWAGDRGYAGVEGRWWLAARTVGPGVGQRGPTSEVRFGYDITPPDAVGSLVAKNASAGTVNAGLVRLEWDNREYDQTDLSGTYGWAVRLNGSPVSASADTTHFPRLPVPEPAAITIENLRIGNNVIEVAVVDKAGNVGPFTSIQIVSEPDAPLLTITNPAASDAALRLGAPISVTATSPSGVSTVTVDVLNAANEVVRTRSFTSAQASGPGADIYTFDPAVRGLPDGSYRVWARAWNAFGSTEATRVVTVDLDTPNDYSTRISLGGRALPETPMPWFNAYPWLSASYVASATNVPDPLRPVTLDGFEYGISRSSTLVFGAGAVGFVPVNVTGGVLADERVNVVGLAYLQGDSEPLGQGVWWMHVRSVAATDTSGYGPWIERYGIPSAAPFGYDITPPNAIPSGSVRVANASVLGTVSAGFARVEWPNSDGYDQDGLSGVWGYSVRLNGSEVRRFRRPFSASVASTSTVDIHDLVYGKNTIEVAAIDNAGNTGAYSPVTVYSAPRPPTITWVSPSGNRLLADQPISVDASAGTGAPDVGLSILNADMTNPRHVTTFTATPGALGNSERYSILPSSLLSTLPAGQYVLRAVGVDRLGRSVETTRPVLWGSEAAENVSPDEFETAVSVGGVPLPKLPDPWFNSVPNLAAAFSTDPNFAQFGGRFVYTLSKESTVTWPADPAYPFAVTTLAGPLANLDLNMAGWGSVTATSTEGVWYVHSRTWTPTWSRPYGVPTSVRFGYDVTLPSMVETVSVTNALPSTITTVAANQAFLAWPNREYDQTDLSRLWGYVVKLNGTEITAYPHRGSFNTSETLLIENLLPGKNVIEVAARDNAGNTGPARIVTVYSNPQPPAVRFTAPAEGGSLLASAPITIEASAGTGPPTVALSVGNTLVATFDGPPYSILPTSYLTTLPAGTYQLRAVATDLLGRSTTATRSVTWTPPVPTVSITAPSLDVLNRSFEVAADAVSGMGVSYVRFAIVGTSIVMTDTTAPYAFTPDMRGVARGNYTISVTATNAFGTSPAVTKLIYWDPPAPTPVIASPSGTTLTHGAVFTADASTPDPQAPVSRVEFYVNGVLGHTSVQAPHTYTPELTGVPSGTVVLMVRAYNVYGVGEVSRSYTWVRPVPRVTITDPVGSTVNPLSPVKMTVESQVGTATGITLSVGGQTATFTRAPYELSVPWNQLPAGTYVISGSATNQYGTGTGTKSVTWNPSTGGGFTPSPIEDVDLQFEDFKVFSATNPSDPKDPEAWWRQAWGKTMFPQFNVEPPSVKVEDVGHIIGLLYSVDRTGGTIDPSRPSNYFRTSRGDSTNLSQVIDIGGILNAPPTGGWPPLTPGASKPEEGRWFWNFSFTTSRGYTGSTTNHVVFGIDRTSPAAVESLTVSPSMNPAAAGGWTASSRAHISWRPKQYDALSGVGYYQVLIDDQPVIPNSPQAPSQGRVYDVPGVTPSSITIENMPPGKRKVSVVCVDRATNEGPAAVGYFYSDPDEPGGTILNPSASGVTLNGKAILSVNATDAAGVSSVTFAIDGKAVKTINASTVSTSTIFTFQPTWSDYTNGTHTLAVTVRDMLARETVLKRSFVLDRTAPRLASSSVSPNPFYPRVDGYRDTTAIKFSASEYTTVTLEVARPGTKPVEGKAMPSSRRWYKRTTGPRSSFRYDGKSDAGNDAISLAATSQTKKYWTRVVLRDAVGNTRYGPWMAMTAKTEVQFVRVAPDRVEVVQR